ncbi:50S ribosomal protein L15 [Candidatus Woesebacteria bacterium RIFCSPHIGHO2_01_FULL_39_17]|uniref:Large ribosomal subunit protein uL15 n=4 Tax=Microgenomates group TaxID=1794810 RepID=A0A0H4TVR4_9BACT|nr:50S ribosomal protein L15 [uncultured Microgenomates bacterium Rifle_16ft_4_minimus_954]KKQ51942.1 MAG: 50S ribosomal protein L15 [Microgenomates group bacterium GW2011_GWC1_38_12]KKQ94394.1 MAG: 50S ribosomal protein L15 [Candidatus Woesebacteria bacterium GW2011_GWB1_39_10b]KKR14406.1 MAG: 50S ribosomal protein L15 [Candidatus Woesebacteria bacterium GW2011_GWA1_39_21b]OGM23796.1 MAG: 50S ribosomal protein L15 [Candidatus Woesebacteria bacterium RIFCSPHIGHO2_01_FULL_39_17]OGM61220.1 MAG: 
MKKLPKVVSKGKKRLGRGYGSGRGGHTVGRGQKGQKARSSIGILFEGVKMKKSLIKRLPLRRGKGKFKAKDKPIIVKTAYLDILPSGSTVDLELLVSHGIVDRRAAQDYGVKILGDGEVKKKLTIAVPISKSAAKMIEKAGGRVVPEKSN